MKFRLVLVVLLASVILAACGGPEATPATPAPAPTELPAPTAQAQTLTVMTHDSFAASEDVVQEFEAENNVTVQFLKSGDAGVALNKAILSMSAPLADVFYGVDNTLLSRALSEAIFEAYESPLLAQIPDQFELDPAHQALPVDYGDVCLNYDKAYFQEKGLQPPADLPALTQAEYKGLLVVENPASSSPGLAFLLATVATFGEDGYLDYWASLKANDVLVVDDWESAYYGQFSGSSGEGPRPIVVSYASSPPAEVIFASSPITEAPTASVVSDGSCFRQVEFVGILKGTPNRALAEKWVDFMLGQQFQEDVPLQMFVYPVNDKASLPEAFVQYAQPVQRPAELSPDAIAQNRDKWIEDWTNTVLR